MKKQGWGYLTSKGEKDIYRGRKQWIDSTKDILENHMEILIYKLT